MGIRCWTSLAAALLLCTGYAFANAPIRNSTFDLTTPKFGGYQPRTHKLKVVYEADAIGARLVLPNELAASLRTPDTAHGNAGASIVVITMALAGLLIVGFLAMRMPSVRFAACVLVPIGVAVFGVATHAQTGPLESPRTTIESGKMRITRGAGAELQLILSKRAK